MSKEGFISYSDNFVEDLRFEIPYQLPFLQAVEKWVGSGDKHFKNMHFMNLTFRMLVNIHFQNLEN